MQISSSTEWKQIHMRGVRKLFSSKQVGFHYWTKKKKPSETKANHKPSLETWHVIRHLQCIRFPHRVYQDPKQASRYNSNLSYKWELEKLQRKSNLSATWTTEMSKSLLCTSFIYWKNCPRKLFKIGLRLTICNLQAAFKTSFLSYSFWVVRI